MSFYYIVAASLILSLVCCAWLAIKLKKSKRELESEKFKTSPWSPLRVQTVPLKTVKITSSFIAPVYIPSESIDRQLAHQIASKLPQVWMLEKEEYDDLQTIYRASIMVCVEEGEA